MITEQITRTKLVNTWEARLAELRSEGEDASHISGFLTRVKRLRGQDVGDLCHYAMVRQAEQRPIWSMIILICCVLAGMAAFQFGGIKLAFVMVGLVGCLGFYHQQLNWNNDEAFARELLARADYAL